MLLKNPSEETVGKTTNEHGSYCLTGASPPKAFLEFLENLELEETYSALETDFEIIYFCKCYISYNDNMILLHHQCSSMKYIVAQVS